MVLSMVSSFITDTVYTVRAPVTFLSPPAPLRLPSCAHLAPLQLRHMNYRQLLQQLISLGAPHASAAPGRARGQLTPLQALS